jgi:hypothetical protein
MEKHLSSQGYVRMLGEVLESTAAQGGPKEDDKRASATNMQRGNSSAHRIQDSKQAKTCVQLLRYALLLHSLKHITISKILSDLP